ncbi:MAG: CoA activase [Desulfobacterota bacterium]|jgi:predicted nucleotide-binding protein (sugar kinase/HSP70/actin superfamily)|nr:CoA activase [Thermodesulfobacteriota bacterium]
MEAGKIIDFRSLSEAVGKFHIGRKKVLLPAMNRISAHLLAGTFRAFGIEALVLATYGGLDLGKQYTSGKECYPCQVTLGDVLAFIRGERERLGRAFHPEDYIYFMPESDGPCRFGLYNKFQRLVLDSIPGLDRLKICSLTTQDGYSLAGLLEEERVTDFKKAGFLAVVAGDILDRLVWRVRPYEREPGATDAFAEGALHRLAASLETWGAGGNYEPVLAELDEILAEAKDLIDPQLPPKPLIGMVGEIFLRMHRESNQDLIRLLEKYGAEVENASMAEWVNYVSYERLREARKHLTLHLRLLHFTQLRTCLRDILDFGLNLLFQEATQKKIYRRTRRVLDLAEDHRIAHLEKILDRSEVFSFDVRTEACLSIGGILQCAAGGYNGVVNVYPFTCMPSITTSAIVKPLLNERQLPYLDAHYVGSFQPGREAALSTFLYQARQHFGRHGRKRRAETRNRPEGLFP